MEKLLDEISFEGRTSKTRTWSSTSYGADARGYRQERRPGRASRDPSSPSRGPARPGAGGTRGRRMRQEGTAAAAAQPPADAAGRLRPSGETPRSTSPSGSPARTPIAARRPISRVWSSYALSSATPVTSRSGHDGAHVATVAVNKPKDPTNQNRRRRRRRDPASIRTRLPMSATSWRLGVTSRPTVRMLRSVSPPADAGELCHRASPSRWSTLRRRRRSPGSLRREGDFGDVDHGHGAERADRLRVQRLPRVDCGPDSDAGSRSTVRRPFDRVGEAAVLRGPCRQRSRT